MSNFDFEVRLSAELFQQLHGGYITPSMLLTMGCLYNWADWTNGIVEHVSAGGLHTWTLKAYSERTFSEALRKLEWMGWITRHMKLGSHKSYKVTIHNYKRFWLCNDESCCDVAAMRKGGEGAGKVHILNPKDITLYEEFPNGRCGETSDETSDEGSSEGSDETSDRTSLNTNLNTNLKNESQERVSNPLSKKESKQALASPKSSTLALGETGQEQPHQSSGDEQEQPLPQTFQELVDSDDFTTSTPTELLFKISPNITDAMVREQLPVCKRILNYFSESQRVNPEFLVLAAEMVLKYNRAHRSGKYATKDDKKLLIRTAKQFLKALESESASLMNDYDSHEFDSCETCQKASVIHHHDLIREILKDREKEEEAKLAAIENAKIAAEQKAQKARWAAYNFAISTPEQKERLHANSTFDLKSVVKSYYGGSTR